MDLKTKSQSDIIIPIYNAYDCLSECIDSVIENTDLENNGLILINDKSTDDRVSKLLNKYKKKYSYIKVLENKKNLGFVGTANRGMKLSKNDVLLLNSDTIVTPRWLEKIKECAYSNEMVATVTPLSNNATLSSVPNIFEKNELPKDLSLNEMSKLVEECSYKDYPEIPTAHGFCMYIKRSVLDQVGYFDEEAFGKGYGEENDFCFRCFDYGYRHLLCDNTYIYHKESQSFSKKKYELMENGRKVLEQRYPQYLGKLDNWNSERPIKYIGQNIAFELGRREEKKNILILIHDWRDAKNNVGGTTLHVYDLIRNLRNKYNFHVLAPEGNVYKLYSYWTETETQIIFPKTVDFKVYPFYNRDYEKMLESIVSTFSIDIVHIHHMIGHYFDITKIIKKFSLYSLFSVHDFYSINPMINKLYKGKEYCESATEKKCNECLVSSLDGQMFSIINWRKSWGDFFKVVDEVVCPSESAKKEILSTYRDLEIRVIEHGIDIPRDLSKRVISRDEKFNVAFIGAIGKHKGFEILKYLSEKKRFSNIRLHLFGIAADTLKDSRIFKQHGRYRREELPFLMRKYKINLVCLFSLTPETYCYTLTESVACGLPVLGVDIGAIGERIKKHNLGWLIPPDAEEEEYVRKIKEISMDLEAYGEKIQSVRKYEIKTTRKMARDYEKLYSEGDFRSNEYNGNDIKKWIKISDRYFFNIGNPFYPDYSWVFNTLKWRIISKLKIPKSIKVIYSKIKNS